MIKRKIKNIFHSNLFGNLSALMILQLLTYVFPLITVPYLYRVLGVELYGLVSFSAAFMVYFTILTDFGFNLSAVREISVNRDSKEKVEEIFNSVSSSRILLCICSLLILLVILFTINPFSEEKQLYLLSFTIVFGNAIFPIWFFQGLEKMKYITIINIVARTVSILPIFFVVKNESDYLFVPIFYGLGSVISGIVSLIVIHHKFKIRFYIPKISSIVNSLKDSATYFLSRLSLSLYTATNTFLIGLILGNTAVGYYAAADKLYQGYSGLLAPITQAIYPYMAKNKDLKLWKKITKLVSVSNGVVAVVVAWLATEILLIVYGEIQQDIVNVFRILTLTTIITFPSILSGYPLLAAWGHPKFVNSSVMVASIVHITGLSVLVFSKQLSLVSVACMVMISECVVYGVRIWGYKKYIIRKTLI